MISRAKLVIVLIHGLLDSSASAQTDVILSLRGKGDFIASANDWLDHASPRESSTSMPSTVPSRQISAPNACLRYQHVGLVQLVIETQGSAGLRMRLVVAARVALQAADDTVVDKRLERGRVPSVVEVVVKRIAATAR